MGGICGGSGRRVAVLALGERTALLVFQQAVGVGDVVQVVRYCGVAECYPVPAGCPVGIVSMPEEVHLGVDGFEPVQQQRTAVVNRAVGTVQDAQRGAMGDEHIHVVGDEVVVFHQLHLAIRERCQHRDAVERDTVDGDAAVVKIMHVVR